MSVCAVLVPCNQQYHQPMAQSLVITHGQATSPPTPTAQLEGLSRQRILLRQRRAKDARVVGAQHHGAASAPELVKMVVRDARDAARLEVGGQAQLHGDARSLRAEHAVGTGA